MRMTVIGVLFFSAVVCLDAQCRAEDITLCLDDRNWKTGYSAESEGEGIQELVLEGESTENWSELITMQAFFGLEKKTTPQEYLNSMIGYLRSICPDLMYNVIKTSDVDVIFEWEIKNCPGEADQYELGRIISGSAAIWYIHYATKKLPVSAETRDKWIKLLDASGLRSP